MIRSGLRRLFRFWRPAVAALHAARFPCAGARGQKWAYLCAGCRRPFPRKQVQIDHVVPAGELTDYAHVGEFLRRLTPESPAAYQVLCKACHTAKTQAEQTRRRIISVRVP
jgi:5-methylcytosine-specific restriction endonuclease McrA